MGASCGTGGNLSSFSSLIHHNQSLERSVARAAEWCHPHSHQGGRKDEAPSLPEVRRAPASLLGRWMALLAGPDVERRSPPRPLRLACLREPVVRARKPAASDSAHTTLEGRVMRNVALAEFSQFALTSGAGTRAAWSSGAAGVLVD